jgi:DNA topoisomerase-1
LPKQILVITEKPSSAKRLANALDEENNPQHKHQKNVTYYISRYNGDTLFIVSAIGHLYSISQKGRGWNYPVFEYEWVPSYTINKKKSNTKAYIETIKFLSKNIHTYVSACDYDLEGSLIAFNILRHAIGADCLKNSKRMLYSTLTKEELRESWSNMNELDFTVINAGRARHEIDWLYGINLSRALTISVRSKIGNRKTLSIGRVQGPTLNFIREREMEIQSFVPIPYWKIYAESDIDGKIYNLEYEESTLDREIVTREIAKKCRGKTGQVTSISLKSENKQPPYPFNLSDLQKEAHRVFKISPKETLKIAEKLYLSAYISYPRTDSQKIPSSIDIIAILNKLKENKEYSTKVSKILESNNFTPREGNKDDPAHPAIHPTGEKPERIKGNYNKIYDLIVKRFLSCLSGSAKISKTFVKVDIEGFTFYLKGSQAIERGWMNIYEPYVREKELLLPEVEENMDITITKIKTRRHYTNPPQRFNPSSILRYMENQNIGTKATRTNILDTLYSRNYIKGNSIRITKLGFSIIKTLSIFCNEIISVEMTRELEEKLEKIQSGKLNWEKAIHEIKKELKPILLSFKSNEEKIGSEIAKTILNIDREENYLGPCPKCKDGEIFIRSNPKTGKIFAGCSNYVDQKCDQSYGLPQEKKIHPTGKSCAACGAPLIKMYFGNKPWRLCINSECPNKKE